MQICIIVVKANNLPYRELNPLCPNGWCELSFFEYLLLLNNNDDTSASISNCKTSLFSLFFLQKQEKRRYLYVSSLYLLNGKDEPF